MRSRCAWKSHKENIQERPRCQECALIVGKNCRRTWTTSMHRNEYTLRNLDTTASRWFNLNRVHISAYNSQAISYIIRTYGDTRDKLKKCVTFLLFKSSCPLILFVHISTNFHGPSQNEIPHHAQPLQPPLPPCFFSFSSPRTQTEGYGPRGRDAILTPSTL